MKDVSFYIAFISKHRIARSLFRREFSLGLAVVTLEEPLTIEYVQFKRPSYIYLQNTST